MYTGFLFCEYNTDFQLLNKGFWSFHKKQKSMELYTRLFLPFSEFKFTVCLLSNQVGRKKKCGFYIKN